MGTMELLVVGLWTVEYGGLKRSPLDPNYVEGHHRDLDVEETCRSQIARPGSFAPLAVAASLVVVAPFAVVVAVAPLPVVVAETPLVAAAPFSSMSIYSIQAHLPFAAIPYFFENLPPYFKLYRHNTNHFHYVGHNGILNCLYTGC